MKNLMMDIETYSSRDLRKSGVYKYAESEDFEILLFAYAIDDEDIQVIDLANGEEIPEEILHALEDDKVEKWAFNANFERVCLSRYLGRRLNPKSWYCSMVWSAYLGLPLSLEKVAEVLRFDTKKMSEGRSLIRTFSIPVTPTKSNGYKSRLTKADEPEKWELFKEYNKRDVEVERAINKKLSAFPIPDFEWENYHIDQVINDRGICVDLDLVKGAVDIDEKLYEKNMKRAMDLTGLENPNSPLQLREWLKKEGLEMDSLAKKEVDKAIKESTGKVREALLLRRQLSKSSIRKFNAIENVATKDKKVRGLIQFYGANRTGRYAGRLIQVQNLRRNNLDDLELARSIVKDGDYELLSLLYDSPADVLSQLIRTAFVPSKGRVLVVSDFTAIEARVLAWLSGETWRMDAFNRGVDIYCESASQMFSVPVEKHGINGHLRQKGKIAELACIAEGELVLTNRGLVPIEEVKLYHKLWDGNSWVTHEGVVYKGIREVIEYEGLRATKDHLVWIEGQQRPIHFGQASNSGAHLLQTGDGRREIRLGENYKPRKKMVKKLEQLLRTHSMSRMWKCSMARQRKSNIRSVNGVSVMLSTKTNTKVAKSAINSSKAKMRKQEGPAVQELWAKRNKIQIQKHSRSGPVFNRKIWDTLKKIRNRQNRQQWALPKGKYSICRSFKKQLKQKVYSTDGISSKVLALCEKCGYKKTISRPIKKRSHPGCQNCCRGKKEKLAIDRGKARVYDIRNAGPHHRFTVSGKLVHNCGYQGSVGALKAMGGLEMGLSEDELQSVVDSWREANPNIVNLWYEIDRIVKSVIKSRGRERYKNLLFSMEKGILFITLPSKRRLAYMRPGIGMNRFGGESITYEFTSTGGKWERQESYGGKFVENIVQAIARDILASSLKRLNKKYEIVMHVHDEVVIDGYPKDLEDINKIMCQNPSWAKGLVLDAEGFVCDFYRKD
ncbi:DNA polymerase [Allofustis seminis]|uniref:DNA polymerase n=1 Tax=Allofustis seminis TaxID=166939 RepID=UPI00037DD18C|nr:DNA polymerase [Allofustis seminis]